MRARNARASSAWKCCPTTACSGRRCAPSLILGVRQQHSSVQRSLSLLSILLVGCAGPPRGAATPTDQRAAAIEARIPQMRRDTATVLGLSTEGAALEASYDGTVLLRLRAEFLGETGRAVETFYFDSALFLVTRRVVQYDAPLSGRGIDSTTQRYDLTAATTAPAIADSLRTVASELLARVERR